MSGLQGNSILVPVDFSDESLRAIDVALDICESVADVHVIHVRGDLSPLEPGVVWNEMTEDNRRLKAREAVSEQLSGERSRVQPHIEIGDPGHCVVELARELDVDLIVLSSHGRTGISRLFIGSVAERIIRLAECPVLVLKRDSD